MIKREARAQRASLAHVGDVPGAGVLAPGGGTCIEGGGIKVYHFKKKHTIIKIIKKPRLDFYLPRASTCALGGTSSTFDTCVKYIFFYKL